MIVKNTLSIVKKKLVSKYLSEDTTNIQTKSTNINVLLNRVRLDQKKESRKKILFSAVTSLGILVFGILVF